MRQWALVDPDGHGAGVVSLDGDADGHGQSLDGGMTAVPVSAAEAPVLRVVGHHAVLRGGRWLMLPSTIARKIDRARGVRADYAVAAVKARDAILADLKRSGVAEIEQPDELDPRLP